MVFVLGEFVFDTMFWLFVLGHLHWCWCWGCVGQFDVCFCLGFV